jgi:uncharacterized membrane protein YkoI
MVYDIEMLESMKEQLKRLSLAYHNIEDHLAESKNSGPNDGGLIQIANNIEEISRLYRHSQLPNKHPKYISYEEAVTLAESTIPFLKDVLLKQENQQVVIRDGIHYYQLSYYDDDDEAYLIGIDAINGNVRNYEAKQNISQEKNLSTKDALNIAKNFLNRLYKGEMKEEVFYMESSDKKDAVYSFRFTPIRDEVQITSDAYVINIAANSGKILKCTNDFTDTKLGDYKQAITEEEVQETYRESFGDMEYNGLAIIRSFYTRYQPKLTYSYRTIQNQQQVMMFIDVTTGMPVYEMYYIYQPIF